MSRKYNLKLIVETPTGPTSTVLINMPKDDTVPFLIRTGKVLTYQLNVKTDDRMIVEALPGLPRHLKSNWHYFVFMDSDRLSFCDYDHPSFGRVTLCVKVLTDLFEHIPAVLKVRIVSPWWRRLIVWFTR